MSRIEIRRERGVHRVTSDKLLRTAVSAALGAEDSVGRVSVLLCSRREIRRLNREFRDTDKVTDVLSFPDAQGGGDIALCVYKVKRQAREYGHSTEREAAYLAVHSALHLLGYDHVTNKRDAKRMRKREEEIMAVLGLTR
ncbi:MAG: rRNA maturation RNase YbeY [Oscillospiraceae bacterium]|jgi:probable rRNA maturation factor|nr:rRNA maturation RNase YbeY [Oscillospiraceae bacterium]